jgi:hypothetical protein
MLRPEVVNAMYSEPKPKFARLPVNGTWCQRHYAVGRSTNTDCHALECPVGTPEAHPVCSIPKSTHSTQQRTPTRGTDSVSRPLLA